MTKYKLKIISLLYMYIWNILIYIYQRITILDILERALIILRMILWSRNFIKYNFYLFVINYLNSFQCKVQAQEL